jgi:hypothetical protein
MGDIDPGEESDVMVINPKLIAAALAAVRDGGVDSNPGKITDYPEMFVSVSENHKLQAIHFFEEGGVKYALGPLKK